MNLQVEINKRERLLSKISELSGMISNGTISNSTDIDKAVKKALDYVDKCQSINMVITQVMHKSKVAIGDAEIHLSMAVEILDSLQKKIDILNIAIKSKLTDSIISAIEERDKLCAERDNMSDIITMSAWRTEIN